MYQAHAVGRLIAVARAGLIDLNQFTVTEFDLECANDAVNHAAQTSAPFHLTVLGP